MIDWESLEQDLVALAWEDENFRKKLLNDTQAALDQAGLTLPKEVVLKVTEDIPKEELPSEPGVYTLIVPPRPDMAAEGALSEEELDMVAGGGGRTSSTCRQRTCGGYPYARQMSCRGCGGRR